MCKYVVNAASASPATALPTLASCLIRMWRYAYSAENVMYRSGASVVCLLHSRSSALSVRFVQKANAAVSALGVPVFRPVIFASFVALLVRRSRTASIACYLVPVASRICAFGFGCVGTRKLEQTTHITRACSPLPTLINAGSRSVVPYLCYVPLSRRMLNNPH